MFVYLLTKTAIHLRTIRQSLEPLGLKVVSCCSTNALLSTCVRGSGCILITAMDYSAGDVRQLIEKLRTAGYPHAVLIVDLLPTVEKAMEWIRLPICDYFQLQTETEALRTIFRNAEQWSETVGPRTVLRTHLFQQWSALDDGLKSVLRLLYEGLTNREIAQKLSLSPRTVESRRAKLIETFGVTTFAGLIRVATEFMEGDPIPDALLPIRIQETDFSGKFFGENGGRP